MTRDLLRVAFVMLAVGIGLAGAPGLAGAADLKARTGDGRDVVLRGNGTWSFVDAGAAEALPAAKTTRYVSRHGYVEVNFDPEKWNLQRKQTSEDAELSLDHKNGDAYFVLIAERVEIPLENFKDIALANVHEIDPKARIVSERKVSRNGGGEMVLDVEATVSGIPLRFRGYYWTSPAGSVQATAWTARNLMQEYSADIDQLLAGVRAHQGD